MDLYGLIAISFLSRSAISILPVFIKIKYYFLQLFVKFNFEVRGYFTDFRLSRKLLS